MGWLHVTQTPCHIDRDRDLIGWVKDGCVHRRGCKWVGPAAAICKQMYRVGLSVLINQPLTSKVD